MLIIMLWCYIIVLQIPPQANTTQNLLKGYWMESAVTGATKPLMALFILVMSNKLQLLNLQKLIWHNK